MQESTVKNLQGTMKYNGFYDGEVDGIWGSQSQAGFYAMAEAAKHCKADKTEVIKPEVVLPVKGKFKLSDKSLSRLEGVHPDLVKVVKLAITTTPVDFVITEGVRSITRQKELFASKATTTMNSRHLTGHAIDLAAIDEKGNVTWDWAYYFKLEQAVKSAAKELGIKIEWGGDWNFKDGPHWQLPWKSYPV